MLESASHPRAAKNSSRVLSKWATVAGCSTSTCTAPRTARSAVNASKTESALARIARSRTRCASATNAKIAAIHVSPRNPFSATTPVRACKIATGTGSSARSTSPSRMPRFARHSPINAIAADANSARSSMCDFAAPRTSNGIASRAGSTSANQTFGSTETIARSAAIVSIPTRPIVRIMRHASFAKHSFRAPPSRQKSQGVVARRAPLATEARDQARSHSSRSPQ